MAWREGECQSCGELTEVYDLGDGQETPRTLCLECLQREELDQLLDDMEDEDRDVREWLRDKDLPMPDALFTLFEEAAKRGKR